MNRDALEGAAEALRSAKHAYAFTGAGASVESGIPDFRSAGGLWEKYPPEEFATLDAFERNPERLWKLWFELGETIGNAKPNPGHYALAALEQLGILRGIVTQNIDNLHQAAGSGKVIDFHGNAGRIHCLKCHRHAALDVAALGGKAPRCECGEIMKPDVVLFGELIPRHVLFESEALAQQADAVLIVGTSATVYPAAGLPLTSKRLGATVIECNLEATEYTGSVSDYFLEGPSGETLPALVELLR